jgi:hypothetical protein
MPRKVARQRGYDTVYVGSNDLRPNLTAREIADVARAIGTQPGAEFLKAYRLILSTYAEYANAVSNSTPAAVQRRCSAVAGSTKALQKALQELQDTDRYLFLDLWTGRSRKGEKYTGLNEMEGTLSRFLPVVMDVLARIDSEPKRGRMPAYAERALARDLAQILFEETGVMQSARRGGPLDRLLRVAFTHAVMLTPRKDVVDLMNFGLRQLQEQIGEPDFLRLLPAYRAGAETRKVKGTNSRK